jgi:hypothetical protein
VATVATPTAAIAAIFAAPGLRRIRAIHWRLVLARIVAFLKVDSGRDDQDHHENENENELQAHAKSFLAD